ncbi:MAG: hypothetical protein QM756_24245 [Polyangiaceae bacterium]
MAAWSRAAMVAVCVRLSNTTTVAFLTKRAIGRCSLSSSGQVGTLVA